MPAPLLDYQSPIDRPGIDWGERYWRFVPIFALSYVPCFVAYVLASIILDPRGDGPLFYQILERAVFFQTVLLLIPWFGCFALLLGGAINALLFGVAAVGLWHLTSIAIPKFRKMFTAF